MSYQHLKVCLEPYIFLFVTIIPNYSTTNENTVKYRQLNPISGA